MAAGLFGLLDFSIKVNPVDLQINLDNLKQPLMAFAGLILNLSSILPQIWLQT
jgi:hypothetical protein